MHIAAAVQMWPPARDAQVIVSLHPPERRKMGASDIAGVGTAARARQEVAHTRAWASNARRGCNVVHSARRRRPLDPDHAANVRCMSRGS